jgi:uncharacterized protein YndB with AHSA1/START domain
MTEDPRALIDGSLHSSDGVGVVRLRTSFESDITDVWSAVTDPQRLALWFGNVTGDFRVGGEFTAFVFSSGWDGRGRVDTCVPRQQLRVTMWEEEVAEKTVEVELGTDGGRTCFKVEIRGAPFDVLWVFGAGWHEHVEDLAAHLAGRNRAESLGTVDSRFDELAPRYQAMAVESLDHQ